MKSKSLLVSYIPVSFWDEFHFRVWDAQHENPAVLEFVRRGMQEAFPQYKDPPPVGAEIHELLRRGSHAAVSAFVLPFARGRKHEPRVV